MFGALFQIGAGARHQYFRCVFSERQELVVLGYVASP